MKGLNPPWKKKFPLDVAKLNRGNIRRRPNERKSNIELKNNNPVVFTIQMTVLNTPCNKKFSLDVARTNWKNIRQLPSSPHDFSIGPTTPVNSQRVENCARRACNELFLDAMKRTASVVIRRWFCKEICTGLVSRRMAKEIEGVGRLDFSHRRISRGRGVAAGAGAGA